ncbi:MAG: hypothetical protein IKK41_00470 [Oscillospiraceae bacterium]|nr:hypothetical protein [Oscillospiraceae bacterium]
MKRITATILAIVLLFSFAACSATPPAPTGNSGSGATAAPSETTLPAQTQAGEISFEEVTVVDNDQCTIKITSIDEDALFGYTLNAYLENKSADKTYMFSVKSASINGVMADPLFAAEVAPGKKANEHISWLDSAVPEAIGNYTDIELNFWVYDSNDWMADPVAEQTVHIYPYGEENAKTFVRTTQDTDTVLIDNENVTAIVTGYEEDDLWGYTAKVFFVNKTDKTVMFTVEDVSVNGFMADPFFANEVDTGKCAFSSISWSDTTLEENGITEIQTIELTIRAYDSNDLLADDLAKETVTLNP